MTLFIACLLARRRRKEKKIRKRNRRVPCMAPRAFPNYGDKMCCVRIKLPFQPNGNFMKFFLPFDDVFYCNHPSSHPEEFPLPYIRHADVHSYVSGRRAIKFLNGPFSSGFTRFYSSSACGRHLYSLGNNEFDDDDDDDEQGKVCYKLSRCDLTSDAAYPPNWLSCQPLYSHRFQPKMITVDDKLFVFDPCDTIVNHKDKAEGEGEFSQNKPLGFLYDTKMDSWTQVLCFPSGQEVQCLSLVVAPLGKRLLVIDKWERKLFYYDIENSSWTPFEMPHLIDDIWTIRGETVQVGNTILWLDERGEIRAFDSENLRLFRGSFVGFGDECDFKNLNFSLLVHVMGDGFCLIWSDKYDSLHFTVLHLCFYPNADPLSPSPHRLIAHASVCFRYFLQSPFILEDAFLRNGYPPW